MTSIRNSDSRSAYGDTPVVKIFRLRPAKIHEPAQRPAGANHAFLCEFLRACAFAWLLLEKRQFTQRRQFAKDA